MIFWLLNEWFFNDNTFLMFLRLIFGVFVSIYLAYDTNAPNWIGVVIYGRSLFFLYFWLLLNFWKRFLLWFIITFWSASWSIHFVQNLVLRAWWLNDWRNPRWNLLICLGLRNARLSNLIPRTNGWLNWGNCFSRFRCFWSLSFLFWLSPGNRFHTASKEKIVHVFLEIGSFSVGIKRLFFVLDWLILIDPETSFVQIGHKNANIFSKLINVKGFYNRLSSNLILESVGHKEHPLLLL